MAEKRDLEGYTQFAEDHELRYLGYYPDKNDISVLIEGEAPPTTRTLAKWQCIYCDRFYNRSLNKVQSIQFSCICRSKKAINEGHYFELAEKLGIHWEGRTLPKNAHEPTPWKNSKGAKKDIPYRSLAYIVPRNLESFVYPDGVPDKS